MYGIEKIKVGDKEVNLSSRERTLIDLIYFNKPVGGITAASRIFTEIVSNSKCDIKMLIRYTVCFPNSTIRKRIGLMLDDIGVSENILKPLVKSIKKTSISSLSSSRKGVLNKKWRVIVNDSRK
jgi:predicted transcriptional regulator of viral defense system